MKKEIYILFTAGRGPTECGLAVHGIQKEFKKFLITKNILFEIISHKKGDTPKSTDTILFKTSNSKPDDFEGWIGTIQWICKSPIRNLHKRKNWFIKCIEIEMPEKLNINTNDIMIQSFRASGPGGQHRNKVETAIRIIHKSTGIIVTETDGKSQAQNKKKALQKLIEKIDEFKQGIQKGIDLQQWNSKIEIERGNPVKTFKGTKFDS